MHYRGWRKSVEFRPRRSRSSFVERGGSLTCPLLGAKVDCRSRRTLILLYSYQLNCHHVLDCFRTEGEDNRVSKGR